MFLRVSDDNLVLIKVCRHKTLSSFETTFQTQNHDE